MYSSIQAADPFNHGMELRIINGGCGGQVTYHSLSDTFLQIIQICHLAVCISLYCYGIVFTIIRSMRMLHLEMLA